MTVDLPPEAGPLAWHGHTRFAGPGLVRNFGLAPAGHHRVIPDKIFPGGRAETYRRQGFDLLLFESADRSDSCLVWAGAYNEATTWFSGPAPRRVVLNRLVSSVSFVDAPEGAKLTPMFTPAIQQYGTMVLGVSDDLILMIRDARAAKDRLPTWQGAPQGDAEVWKEQLDLDPEQQKALAGTPFEWRYTFANPTSVFTLVFPRSPGAASLRSTAENDRVDAVMSNVKVAWSA
ncbi:hypothetical protein [Sphaerisporangium fuscum]|uniref:hypothetical protein n=1 Tax=Sphaerisporangium fuscum TaxID=2835868 RepID=UPI001BDD854D|nr:hypothetical protein [Sphaerisporangium fuscum]